MTAQPVGFDGINQQLDFSNTSPITINDTLVRALTGKADLQTTRSAISFADLSGKVGVAEISGAKSNTQSSYFNPTVSTLEFSFVTDVYNPQISWSTTLPSSVVFVSNGANATATLTRSSVGVTSVTGTVTASLSYQGTFIGSKSANVSLSSEVYNPAIQFVNSPSQNLSVSGFSAQTATVTVSITSNVVGNPNVTYNVSPMNSGVFISNTSVVLTRTSSSVSSIANSQSYTVTAAVTLNSQAVAMGSEVVTLSSQRYSPAFTMTSSGNSQVYANSGELTSSATFTVTGNAPTTAVIWSSSPISGSPSNFVSNNASATLSLPISNTSVPYNALNSITSVSASLVDLNSSNAVLGVKSANVQLAGVTSGLQTAIISNTVIANGFTAQTATFQTSANVQSGSLSWIVSNVSGVGVVSSTSGSSANLSITETRTTVGSNTGVWNVSPAVSAFGSTFFSGSPQTITVTAKMVQSSNVTISGPASNVVVANSGTAVSSISLLAGNVSPGTSVVWSASPRAGSNVAAFNSNTSSASLSLIQTGNGYSYATYDVTANCYDISSNNSLSTATKTVTLESGVYGANVVVVASNTQSGYTAQTASSLCSATFASGTATWQTTANSSGFVPTVAGPNPSVTMTASQVSVGSNSQSYPLILAIFDTNGSQVASLQPGTVSLLSQVNAYSVSTSSYVNTQIVTSPSGVVSATAVPTTSIPGGSFSSWQLSQNTGATLTTNSSAAIVSYDMSQSLTANSPGYSYSSSLTCNLLDANNRFVTAVSNTIILRSYYANPSLSISSSNAVGFVAQTATGIFTSTIVGATGANLALISWSNGNSNVLLGTQTSNATYYSAPFSLSQNTIGTSSGTASFNMAINYYEASYNIPVQTSALSATFNDPAIVTTAQSNTVSGFIAAQTAVSTIVASCNSAVPSQTWIWGTTNTTSGSFTSTGVQGTGNNTYTATSSATTIGAVSGTGFPSSLSLYSAGQLISTVSCPTVTSNATLYNPALIITGPASVSTSNLFESTAVLSVSASANSSIPSVSYISSTSLSSGTAAQSITHSAANTGTTISLDAVHQNLTSNYVVYTNVYCQGVLIQTASKAVTLNASGTIPAYSVSSPSNVSAAGFNFAQTASQTITLTGATHGEFVTWGWATSSGSNPAFVWGPSNTYITSSVSRSSIGTNTSIGKMTAFVADPNNRPMTSVTTPSYSMTSTVYNPALVVNNGSWVNVLGKVPKNIGVSATASVSISSNTLGSSGHYYLGVGTQVLGSDRLPGAVQSASRGTSNTSYSITISGNTPDANGVPFSANTNVPYSIQIIYNGQVIAGPVSGTLSAGVSGVTSGTPN